MRPPASHTGRVRGFTLVELTVVVILIGVMLSVVLPEMRGTYEDALLRKTARTLVSACSLAHSQAITTGRQARLHLDAKKGAYRIETFAPASKGKPGGFTAVENLPDAAGAWDPRIELRLLPVEPAEEEMEPRESHSRSYSRSQPHERDDAGERPAAPQSQEWLKFQPDGTTDPVRIALQDRAGFGMALILNPVTSRIRVTDPQRENLR